MMVTRSPVYYCTILNGCITQCPSLEWLIRKLCGVISFNGAWNCNFNSSFYVITVLRMYGPGQSIMPWITWLTAVVVFADRSNVFILKFSVKQYCTGRCHRRHNTHIINLFDYMCHPKSVLTTQIVIEKNRFDTLSSLLVCGILDITICHERSLTESPWSQNFRKSLYLTHRSCCKQWTFHYR